MKMKNEIKNILGKAKNFSGSESFKKKIDYFNQKYLICVFILSFILDFIMEAICRHSLISPLLHIVRNPVMFIFNVLILFLFLGFGCFFRRRILYATLVSLVCLILASANGILLNFRTTPFAAVDFTLIPNVMTIVDLYLSWFQIILIALVILILVALCIFLGIKLPKFDGKMYRLPTILITVVFFLSLSGLDNVLINIGVSPENYSNLAEAYKKYGFTYCFTNSFMKLGMDKPENYTSETIEEILEEKLSEYLEEEQNSSTNDTEPVVDDSAVNIPVTDDETIIDSEPEDISQPNIIFVQLESFFDMSRVIGLEYSEDPLPNFRYLKENYSSGFLYVPSIGAGTANTEFEVVTGMNMDFFGPGEYPYKTVLKETTCESAAYDLHDLGYATHAIHNNDGTFYDRNKVYPQLGFDTFTPLEYMYDIELNVNGFSKDSILTKEIMDTMTSTDEKDYIFAVSVQAHGEYSSVRKGEEQPIFIRYTDESKENSWSYYANQIYEVDQFVGELVDTLEDYEEPTVLVLYGDHIPGIDLEADDITNDRLTATEYVIWSNFDMEKQNVDLEAYQLTSHVLDMVGISHGVMTAFHQKSMEDEDYLNEMELLQYDMLYGERKVYGGTNPYIATEMTMGLSTRTIRIYGILREEDGSIYIRGNYFNEFSVVYCNNDPVTTTFIDEYTLKISGIDPEEGDIITVAQVGEDKFALGFSEEYVY